MRIIKSVAGIAVDAMTIAGEIYNIESSTLAYMDGKRLDGPKRGYPRIQIGTVDRVIRSVEGYIFVSPGTNIDVFENEIVGALACLEMADTEALTHLKKYHTLKMSYHTNIKVKSALNVTATSTGRRNNVKRQFARIQNVGDLRKARFTWYIVPISKFEFAINNNNISDAISRYICSVFYDDDDICSLPHNGITFNFSYELLKGYKNLSSRSVMLTSFGHPLAFELSSYWRDYSGSITKSSLRNIPRAKVYEAEYGLLKLKPVKLSDEGKGVEPTTSTEVCSKCRSLLYGDNYVLYGNIKNPDADVGVAICPLCLHTSPGDKPIEMKYFRVFRVTFPRSADSIIEQEQNPDIKDIFNEASKGVFRKRLEEGDRIIDYAEIGDKWVGFNRMSDYLFTRFSIHDNRRVVIMKSLELIK